ncbi:MAG: AAA family ATPase [Alphaproteobacteria bacterium]
MSLEPVAPVRNPDLLGQEAAEAALLRAWRSGRPPHGWLFTGRFGIGKATLAYRFARFLLAGGGDGLAVPADHPVVGPMRAGAHPDLVVVEPPPAGRGTRAAIRVEDVRGAIERIQRTSVGATRVLIIDQAHTLNDSSANALLKTLEEPPAGVVVILTAEGVDRFPATIRSRLARLRLKAVPEATIGRWLERAYAVEPDAAAAAAALAGGSPGLALWLLANDAPAHYAALTGRLAQAAGSGEAGIAGVADALTAMLEAGEAALPRELVGQLVRRAVGVRLGLELAPLAEAEAPILAGLGGGRLDRLWEVWDKLAILDDVAERLSLDRPSLLVDIAASLAGAEPARRR